jgi:hypothetical protein
VTRSGFQSLSLTFRLRQVQLGAADQGMSEDFFFQFLNVNALLWRWAMGLINCHE